jgi:hypothetical protein
MIQLIREESKPPQLLSIAVFKLTPVVNCNAYQVLHGGLNNCGMPSLLSPSLLSSKIQLQCG